MASRRALKVLRVVWKKVISHSVDFGKCFQFPSVTGDPKPLGDHNIVFADCGHHLLALAVLDVARREVGAAVLAGAQRGGCN